MVDAGFVDLVRPAMYGSYHAIDIVGKETKIPTCRASPSWWRVRSARAGTSLRATITIARPAPVAAAAAGDLLTLARRRRVWLRDVEQLQLRTCAAALARGRTGCGSDLAPRERSTICSRPKPAKRCIRLHNRGLYISGSRATMKILIAVCSPRFVLLSSCASVSVGMNTAPAASQSKSPLKSTSPISVRPRPLSKSPAPKPRIPRRSRKRSRLAGDLHHQKSVSDHVPRRSAPPTRAGCRGWAG